MTDEPNTTAPAVPAVAEVVTVISTLTDGVLVKIAKQPIEAVDFYAEAA